MSKFDEIMDRFPKWGTAKELDDYIIRYLEVLNKKDGDLDKFIAEERENWVKRVKLN